MRTILLFGDSIAEGYNAPQMEGWAYHLKKFIEERDTEAQLINLAKAEEMTPILLSHMEADLEKYKPEEVIVAIGINDAAYSFKDHRSRTPREKFEENVTAIIELAQKYVKKVIVVGLTNVDEKGSTFSLDDNTVIQYQNIVIQRFNDSLKGIASLKQVGFIDVYGALDESELPDGLHPNKEGHEKLYKVIQQHV